MEIFGRLESNVRGYCRSFPVVFNMAKGSYLYGENGRRYLDFFAGAGALNYGHNHPDLKRALLEYLQADGVTHALDMATVAKRRFIESLEQVVLMPRDLRYKVQFPGPTGTNAVEAALKLARKATGRNSIVAFTNGFHGMTLGSLAVTGNGGKRAGAGVALGNATVMPFDGYLGDGVDSLAYFSALLNDKSSGLDKPAAVIVETVQAEGGVNVAGEAWLRQLRALTQQHGMLLIVDDIQVGCGRTGPFFSFERAGIQPDIVCLSKSLSGYGLPLALVLMKPDLDVWEPGEHNGTFRGHNPAFITASAALEMWRDGQLSEHVTRLGQTIAQHSAALADRHADLAPRGIGLIRGLVCPEGVATLASRLAFERGLIIETAGANDEVLKMLPPLTISESELNHGLDIIEQSVELALRQSRSIKRSNSSAREPKRAVDKGDRLC
jgi:diaminobutyrate-2-oxoglutarate transaminase